MIRSQSIDFYHCTTFRIVLSGIYLNSELLQNPLKLFLTAMLSSPGVAALVTESSPETPSPLITSLLTAKNTYKENFNTPEPFSEEKAIALN